jgi:hypothetical protein
VRQFVLWTSAFLITWIALAMLAFVILRWRLHRSNRVSPAMKSPAPIVWLWSPTQPARLHRRLRTATREIHLSPAHKKAGPSLSVDELRCELEYQAVELDHHVVAAAHHPRAQRRSLLRQLDTQITEVERLSVRLSRLSRPAGTPASGWDAQPPEVLERISRQLDLLDEAQDELTEIERAAGLVDIDRLLAPTQKPVAAPLPPPAAGPILSDPRRRSTRPR